MRDWEDTKEEPSYEGKEISLQFVLVYPNQRLLVKNHPLVYMLNRYITRSQSKDYNSYTRFLMPLVQRLTSKKR
ncbi:MAG: hypothetical protein A2Y28_04630 [Chlamydiae bacterium GWC2_50_10]|nr:MAG: hypothetical protein A2Y28_04630 [Chlamydiae bacterium GWC2_50_10]OGN54983.1 MAG: hypothetical protein A2098_02525 [Chlamydiae bacterium GWF2_49_8]